MDKYQSFQYVAKTHDEPSLDPQTADSASSALSL